MWQVWQLIKIHLNSFFSKSPPNYDCKLLISIFVQTLKIDWDLGLTSIENFYICSTLNSVPIRILNNSNAGGCQTVPCTVGCHVAWFSQDLDECKAKCDEANSAGCFWEWHHKEVYVNYYYHNILSLFLGIGLKS